MAQPGAAASGIDRGVLVPKGPCTEDMVDYSPDRRTLMNVNTGKVYPPNFALTRQSLPKDKSPDPGGNRRRTSHE